MFVFFFLPAKTSLLAVFLQYGNQLLIIWQLSDISLGNMLAQLASLVETQLYDLRLEVSFISDATWAALLPLRELPWGQVLIDGPLIHYAVTASVLLWPLGCILLDHCRVGRLRCSHRTKPSSRVRVHKRNVCNPPRWALTDVHM